MSSRAATVRWRWTRRTSHRRSRYVALNPVRARLVADARDWPHSSVAAHLAARDDGLAVVRPILDRVANFADLLATAADDRGLRAVAARAS